VSIILSNRVQFSSCLEVIDMCQHVISEVKWAEHHSSTVSRPELASLGQIGLEEQSSHLPAAYYIDLP